MLLAAVPQGRPAPLPNDAQCLLQADDVKVHFPIRRGVLRRTVGHVRAVDGVSLAVREGETVGLVGESGSGKTTMALAALRLEHATGRITFDGADIATSTGAGCAVCAPACRSCSRIRTAACRRACRWARSSPRGCACTSRGLSRAERARRVAAELEEVGLPADSADRYPHEFSGGQRQRIAIARAMVLKPRFVVLDEPTSALDMSVQAQIVELLRRLQQVHRLAYLFISHDLKVVRALAHRVVVLRHGRVVEQGDADAVFAHPREDYTRALMAAAFALDA